MPIDFKSVLYKFLPLPQPTSINVSFFEHFSINSFTLLQTLNRVLLNVLQLYYIQNEHD